MQPLRQFGHAALAVGQTQLVLAHGAGNLARRALQERCGKIGVPAEIFGHRGQLGPRSGPQVLASHPLGVRGKRALELPQVGRVGHVRLLDSRRLQGLANRLEELDAVVLDQRLEKGHREHFAFAFVDAGGQVLVHVVAKDVTVQERAAAVRLHQHLDGRFLLGLAAKNLGDDAFHFAAVAFVDQPAAPLHQGVASHDQSGNASQPTLHQFAGRNHGTVGSAILGPGDHAGHHQPHRAGRVGAQGNSSQVQPVIGNRQAIAPRRRQQVLRRHAQVLEDDALVVRMLQRPQAVLAQLELLVLLLGQIDDEHRGTLVDQAHQTDRAAGHDVGDKQLLTVDDILVTVLHGLRAQRRQVGTGSRLGQRESAQPLAAGQIGQELLLLLGVAERAHRVDRADAAVHRSQTGHRRIDNGHLRQKGRERGKRRSASAVLLADQQSPVADFTQLVEHALRNLLFFVEVRAGLHVLAHHLQRIVHDPFHFGQNRGLLALEQFHGQLAVPDGLVHGTVDRLIALRKHLVDLVVGFVDSSHAASFVIALAAQLERRLGKRGLVFQVLIFGGRLPLGFGLRIHEYLA